MKVIFWINPVDFRNFDQGKVVTCYTESNVGTNSIIRIEAEVKEVDIYKEDGLNIYQVKKMEKLS